MCEMHEDIYKEIPPEVMKIIEDNQIELHALAEKIGSQIAPHLFSAIKKIDKETGDYHEPKPEDIPEAMTRMLNAAGILYAISWMAAETSPSEDYDQMLTNIFINGVNDGNAYLCVNTSKEKAN